MRKIWSFIQSILVAVGQYEVDRVQRMQQHPEIQGFERLPLED